MDTVVATISGYHGADKFNIIKLICQSGAGYVGSLNPSITHLVCCKFEGKKYEFARKFNIIVVNHRWVEDCVKQGRRVSERPYMKQCGCVMRPFLWDVPVTSTDTAKTTVIDVDFGDDDNHDDDDEKWTDSWLVKELRLSDARKNKDRSNRSKRKLSKRSSRQDVSFTNEYDLPESPSFVSRKIENPLPDDRQNNDCSSKAKRKLNKRSLRQDVSLTNKYDLPEPPSFVMRRIESEDLSFSCPTQRVNRTKETTAMCESSKGYHRLMRKNICNELKSSSDSEEGFQHTAIHRKDVEIGEPSKYSGRDERSSYETRHYHPKRRTLILEDSENIEDLGTSNLQDPACNEDDSNVREKNPTLSTQAPLSCVICWTEYSSTRGVLPCGHRFCFSCIQNWADHMVSIKKVSTCPLCKASFCSIRKMEDAVSSDQKIYSQTIPNNHAAMDVYVLPYGQTPTHQMMPPPGPVCYQCLSREPLEFLIRCYSCDRSSVHSYCLDPPQNPWVCVQCKDLRMRYNH